MTPDTLATSQTLRRTTMIADNGTVIVPAWVVDLDSFRRWLDTDDLPDTARAWFLKGEVWVDMSKEQLYTHVDVKTEIASVLRSVSKVGKLGRVLGDGVLLTNRPADLSGNPDAVFISNDAQATGRIKPVAGKEGGFVELDGTPDMVLEVVSDSSEKKDNQTLFEAYWEAGIPEYWLVDARGTELEFTIYKRGPKAYTAVRKQAGWQKSAVFGKAFKLTRGTDAGGNPEFTLDVK